MKRFLATILIIISAFTLFACDNGDESSGKDNPGADKEEGVQLTMTIDMLRTSYFTATVSRGANKGMEYKVTFTNLTAFTYDGKIVNKSYLKEGATVTVTYDGTSSRSIPPQIHGTKIDILSLPAEKSGVNQKSLAGSISEDSFTMIASVISIGESITVEVTSSDYAYGTYVIHVSDSTLITDVSGNTLELSDIKPNDTLYVEYGGAVTLSLPPQTTAIRIVRQ